MNTSWLAWDRYIAGTEVERTHFWKGQVTNSMWTWIRKCAATPSSRKQKYGRTDFLWQRKSLYPFLYGGRYDGIGCIVSGGSFHHVSQPPPVEDSSDGWKGYSIGNNWGACQQCHHLFPRSKRCRCGPIPNLTLSHGDFPGNMGRRYYLTKTRVRTHVTWPQGNKGFPDREDWFGTEGISVQENHRSLFRHENQIGTTWTASQLCPTGPSWSGRRNWQSIKQYSCEQQQQDSRQPHWPAHGYPRTCKK